jgi:peptidoglycan hydrolase-like protein with peptidoglycan-binding domain
MIKTWAIILLVFFLSIIFIEPVRNYLNNFFHKEKGELTERQVIGTVSGYNPRVKEAQEILKDAGFEPGPVDGIMGGQTRSALRAFQKAKGLKPTGKVDAVTLLALNREKESPSSLKKEKAEDRSSFLIKESPKDIKSDEEILKIRGPQKKEIKEMAPKEMTKQIQIALKKAGFYEGKIDGVIGRQTRKAVRAFQKSKGLNPDGVVGPKTWEELSKYLKD